MTAQKTLERLYEEGKISRRDFLVRASTLGLTAVLSPMILNQPAHAAAPKKGGRLRLGLTGAAISESFNLAGECCNTWSICITYQARNNLVELDHKGTPTPELAESWESSPDASKWTFKLRKGIEFHNGKTLDAQDVLYTFNLHRKEGSKSSVKSVLNAVNEIKADGKHTVVFELESGNADFAALMSDYHLQIVPDGNDDWHGLMGTGPYMKKSYEPGVRALVVRNPNYWREGRAHFDEVETIAIHDTNARTTALKTGQVDVIDQPDPKTVNLLEKEPGIQVVSVTALRHFTIPMLMDVPPFDNNDVRLALKLCIDREDLLKRILHGQGTVGNDHPIAPIMRFYASELPQRSYDPDKARYHIKKAGMEGREIKLHTAEAAFAGAVDTAILMQASAAKAGIKIKIVREPDDGYWVDVWRKKPWCFCYWSGRGTADWMFSTTHAADAKWNDTHFKNERFNKLLVAARAELDSAKRRQMYVEMQKIVRDEGGTVVPMFANQIIAATTKLHLEKPFAGHLELDGGRGPEKWWFA